MKYFKYLLKIIGINYTDFNISSLSNYVYNIKLNIIIGTLLFSNPSYFLYNYIKYNNKNLITLSIIMYIPLINYIIILKYFNKPYFFKIYYDIKDEYKFNIDKIITLIIIILSILYTILSLILKLYNFNIINYNNNLYKILNIIYLIFYDFYSTIIFLSSAFIFIFVFNKHYIDINKEINRINNESSWSKDKYQTSISIICFNLLFIKNEIEKSIKLLEHIYLYNTILGSITVGIIVEYKNININTLILLILWFIIEILFLYIIFKITNKKENLRRNINKPKFCLQYLVRGKSLSESPIINIINNNFTNNIDNKRRKDYYEKNIIDNTNINSNNINSNNINSINDIEYIKTTMIQNSSTIDWIVLQKILTDEWETFEFLGIKFNGFNGIQKIISIIGTLILLSKILFTDIIYQI